MQPGRPSSQKNLLAAIAASFVLTAIYIWLSPKPPAPDLTDAGTPAVAQVDAGAAGGQNVEQPAIAAAQDGAQPDQAPAPATAPTEKVTRDFAGEDIHYTASTFGAGLIKAELQGTKMREQRPLSVGQGYKLLFGGEVPDAAQMDMAKAPAMFPPALSVSVRGEKKFDPWTNWELVTEESTADKLVFRAGSGPWAMKKTLQFLKGTDPLVPATHGYELAMTVELTNRSQSPLSGELGVHYSRAVEPGTEEKASLLGGVGNESKATCRVNEDLHQIVPDQGIPDAEDLAGPVSFIGVDQQYFLGAVFPVGQVLNGRCELYAAAAGRAAVGLFPIEVQPGQTLTHKFGVYVGPKDTDLLRQEPSPTIAAALNTTVPPGATANLLSTVNFGIWEVLCVVLLAVLKFFHALIGNWGVAIVLLTLTVKIVLLPLTWKQMVAAENMKKLQPRVEELRKKFAEDRERMNMEMMKLYQEAKVNPLGGCFPILIQMPVWIALFTTLRNSYEIYREPFIQPVWTDLTYKDPTYLFPILLGATWIITQRLQPAMMDAAQQRLMTWVMPIMFTVMMLAYPAGLTLYIFTNNLVSIGQQYGIRKLMERKGLSAPKAPTPPAAASKGKKSKKAESGA